MLSVADFKFDRAVLETRYPNGYMFWDRAGIVWSEAIQRWSDLEFVSAEPAKTSFRLGTKYQFDAELGQSRTLAFLPDSSLNGLIEIAKPFYEIVFKHLEVKVLSRIGLRCLLFREFATKEEAVEAIISTRLVHVPSGPHFGIQSPPATEASIIWEDEVRGTRFHLAYQRREYQLQPPADLQHRVKPLSITIHGVLLDTDFYSVSPIQVGQFSAEEWCKQAVHVLRRDTDRLLGVK
jgi:hypothetical protein